MLVQCICINKPLFEESTKCKSFLEHVFKTSTRKKHRSMMIKLRVNSKKKIYSLIHIHTHTVIIQSNLILLLIWQLHENGYDRGPVCCRETTTSVKQQIKTNVLSPWHHLTCCVNTEHHVTYLQMLEEISLWYCQNQTRNSFKHGVW